MASVFNIALRGLQFLWTLLIMSLIGNMIAERVGGSPSIINYYIFVATFSMLSLFYLIPATIKEGLAGSPIILMAVDGINSLLTFCGAVALPAYQRVHSCNNQEYLASNRITNGTTPDHWSKRCREGQASTAFMWFLWASFTGSFVLDIMSGSGSGANLRGGIRRGPSMTQSRV